MPISNPISSPYFLPTLLLLSAFLGLTLLALVLVMHGDMARLRQSTLFARWRVWAVIAPIYSLALLCGDLTALALVSFLVFQGLREYSGLVRLPGGYTVVLLVAGLAVGPAALTSLDAFHLLVPLLFIVATLQPLVMQREGGSVRHLAFAVLGWGYIAYFLGHILLIYHYLEGGVGVLLAIGMGTALSDVGAFVIGKRFGRRKLAPTISPNKTVAGVGGNLLGAYIGIAAMSYALPGRLRLLLVLTLPPIIALGAIWGDLLESSIKREFKTKDAGDWLPGFGGLLDRVDSLILVTPLTYYFLRLLG